MPSDTVDILDTDVLKFSSRVCMVTIVFRDLLVNV